MVILLSYSKKEERDMKEECVETKKLKVKFIEESERSTELNEVYKE
jgi:hypothetical protein